MASYAEFLDSKRITVAPSGFDANALNSMLFDFQSDCAKWALQRGKAALFEDCGLGKTPQQLVWAEQVVAKYNKPVLILAPLAVSKQTVREGAKFGIEAHVAVRQSDVDDPSIYVTNYEKLHHFDPSAFAGVVLDESSILKSYSGATRNLLVEQFVNTPMKLCATATPAPNDYMELGNHSEFLGVLTRTEMLSTFFVHDGGDTSKWRLKGHAEEEYWKWVCQWAVMLRQPSDLGYDNNGFVLPPLRYHHHIVKSVRNLDGFLFPVEAQTLLERRGARRNSLSERVELCASLVNESTEPWLVWCDLNAEGDALARLIPDAVQVAGRDSDEAKEDRLLGFAEGRYRVLVSKPIIAGHGLNLQICSNLAFVGLSDSWEQWYQAVRRCWRFGQTREVNCHVITSEAEGAVVRNIQRKEADATRMAKEMVKHMSVYNTEAVHRGTVRTADTYKTAIAKGERWEMRLGDCVELIKDMPDDSIHYSIFSPPFASLYTYSSSERDMGNARGDTEFYAHFQFLVKESYRVLLPGRLLSFHCMDIPAMKERDGYIGLKDFPGDLIRMFQSAGFIYHSRASVWKDPLIEATRTKALGLMHKQVVKDSAMCRQGLPDYLITMRKPGVNSEPISRPNGFTEFIGEDEPTARKGEPIITASDFERSSKCGSTVYTHEDPVYTHQVWRRYASPVWMDINQSDTLQRESAREEADERHVCPLQLQVIERGLELWTNVGDVVLDPFSGIGSTGYVSVRRGRRFIGFELKSSYYQQACANLRNAEAAMEQTTLFSEAAG
jgi:DNA modification methylase